MACFSLASAETRSMVSLRRLYSSPYNLHKTGGQLFYNLIGKCHGEHLGLCDFLHGMQFSVLQRPQDTQGIVCLAGDEQGTAPSGARLQDYHSKAAKISRVHFPAFVTFFCGSPQTCVPNLIRPQQGAWT